MNDDNKDLAESVGALNKALDAGKYTVPKELLESAALKVQDLSELANKYLTIQALNNMSVRSKQTREVIDLDTQKVTDLIYLGVEVRSDRIEEGAKIIAEQLNLLAAGGYIHSCLAPLSSLELAKRPGRHFTSIVFAYVHCAEENLELAKSLCQNSCEMTDTEPKEAHSMKIDLPDGEFFAFERVTIAGNMIEGFDGKKMIDTLIEMYMAILPKGTELVSSDACAIDSLCVPYELRFRSPVLDKVKEVKLDYVRATGMNSGKLEQGAVLLGIQYLDKNGKDLYESARRPV